MYFYVYKMSNKGEIMKLIPKKYLIMEFGWLIYWIECMSLLNWLLDILQSFERNSDGLAATGPLGEGQVRSPQLIHWMKEEHTYYRIRSPN